MTTPPFKQLLSTFKGSASSPSSLFQASIAPSWMQGRTTYGGCSAALCLEGAKRHLNNDEMPLRSALVSFVGPAGGEVEVRARTIRSGKTMAFVNSELFTSEGELATTCMWAFGSSRESAFAEDMGVEPQLAFLPSPEECSSLFDGAKFVPTFTQHFEARLARGARPGSGSLESDHWIWARHRGVDLTGRKNGSVANVDDDVALVAIADLLPPAIAARFPGASPVSSATWMLNFLSEEREALDSGWFLLRSKAEHARGGYSSQDMAMYGAGGTPIAVGRQCVAIFDKPQPKELPFSPSSKL